MYAITLSSKTSVLTFESRGVERLKPLQTQVKDCVGLSSIRLISSGSPESDKHPDCTERNESFGPITIHIYRYSNILMEVSCVY